MSNESSVQLSQAEGASVPSPPEGPIPVERLRQIKRILAGEEPGEPVPVPQDVQVIVDQWLGELDFEVTPEARERITQDVTLQYYGGGRPVACMRTPRGVILFAIGGDEVYQYLETFSPQERWSARIEHPDPWG